MTTSGWIIMILSVGIVTVLFVWCIWKVLTTPGEEEKMHGFEFETPDERKERES
jgi:heme/copper-type cytochrome/quinol oxidase subunit 2